METKILIIGNVENRELELIKFRSALNGFEVVNFNTVQEVNLEIEIEVAAILSFLMPSEIVLKNIFSLIPVGSAKFIPLFQICKESIESQIRKLPVYAFIKHPLNFNDVDNMLRCITKNTEMIYEHKHLMEEVVKYRKQKQQLLKVGTALSFNHELKNLLELILSESMEMVKADAASIYIRERESANHRLTDNLRFKVAMNRSVELKEINEFTIKTDHNRIAGYVALTALPLNIDNVYEISDDVPYSYNSDYDKKIGYHIKSMITIPLKNIDDIVVGVLQLINKKRDYNVPLKNEEDVKNEVMPFTYSDEEFLQSIASLAAVSIERTQLYEDIEDIFEGFLESSAAAIDERDKVTSGHSNRVMEYAVAFAEEVNQVKDGPFGNKTFDKKQMKQFKFAALLHDIGKIGVPEILLNKENRLDHSTMEILKTRFEREKTKITYLPQKNTNDWHSEDELEEDFNFLENINRAGFIDDESLSNLKKLAQKNLSDCQGQVESIIKPQEFEALSVRKGNLTKREKEVVNSHANSTRRILSKVQWTEDMKDLPKIASLHHEKLDGSGYPDGLTESEIPFESKILAVIDIYDALIAQDRPYKPAISIEKAVSILNSEVEAGHLDRDIVEFFVEKNIINIFNKVDSVDKN